ncbi:MAG TPA: methyltransferase domain-containing protein [Haliangiales bacterium]|nr:methyltransferase domain-containing protein [Haliangiales bacterium]
MGDQANTRLQQLQGINTNLNLENHRLQKRQQELEERHGHRKGLTYRLASKVLSSGASVADWAPRLRRLYTLATRLAAPAAKPNGAAQKRGGGDISSSDWLAQQEPLYAMTQANLRLSSENARLKSQVERLEAEQDSPVYRYVDRLINDLIWGSPRQKLAYVADHARGAARLARGIADTLSWLRDGPDTWLQVVAAATTPSCRAVLASLKRPSENLKIILSSSGGLGDGIWLSAVASAIRHKYVSSDIYVVCSNPDWEEVFADNGNVKGVLALEPDTFPRTLARLMGTLFEKDLCDLWYECKYVTKVHYAPGARVPAKHREETDRAFEGYRINFDQFPWGNNLISEFCGANGMSLFDLVARTACLDRADMVPVIVPSPDDLKIGEIVQTLGDYITIHHGCDPKLRRNGRVVQTKNWGRKQWEAVIAHVKAETGLKVVQIGTADEERLDGTIDYFMGGTNAREASVLLKHARFHLDTEGGMVHLARAVNTRAIVLFGPTPLEFFAYPENINIKEGDCHDCWWSTPDWFQRCPRGLDDPACMDAIRVDALKPALDELTCAPPRERFQLEDLSLFDPKLMGDEESLLREVYRAAGLAFRHPTRHAMNDDTGAYIHGSKNWEYLYAIDKIRSHFGDRRLKLLDAGAGRGALSLYFGAAGHDSHICDLDYAAHSHTGLAYENRFLAAAQGKVSFRFGSMFNLPYEGESFDVVMCISVVEHLTLKRFAIRELLRVLRPDGLLVLTFDLMSARGDHAALAADGNRVEIWDENQLETILADLGLPYERWPDAVEQACASMQRVGVQGIPAGLTVGGMVIRKTAAAGQARGNDPVPLRSRNDRTVRGRKRQPS